MNQLNRTFILLLLCLVGFYCSAKDLNGADIQPDNLFPQVKLETSAGTIIVELNRLRAPITSNNFIRYVASGSYDGTVFHRVVKDFVVQGGGYDVLYHPKEQFAAIYNESGNGMKNEIYTIAMAREDDPHSATNQFYFNMADNQGLDPGSEWGYTVFGVVTEGIEVLNLINGVSTHRNPKLGWEDVPQTQVVLKKAILIEP